MTIQFPDVGMALAALLAAALVAVISTPVVRSLAFRMGAVDIPKEDVMAEVVRRVLQSF